ncbi:MAG: ATP synthase subunit I [Pseudomonadales bacterium]|jgi:ATP synthase protein I|nr:ATP synthase subunit I [Pseudomonadales bacterium]
MSAIPTPPVSRVILRQLAILLILAALAQVFLGTVAAYSILLGGLLSIVPGAYFAYKAMRYRGARATERMVRSVYFAELMKLALTGAGFALVFTQVKPLHVVGLFCGFVLVHVVGLVALARVTLHIDARQ